MSSSSSQLLLCYHTANIYTDDLRTLKPGAWLNDNVISFYMDYLQHEQFSRHAERFRFVSPGTTFILMHEDDESDLSDAFEGCEVTAKTELVFFPLNNNLNVTKSGGSHWTLLVLDLTTNACYSFDSLARGRSHSNSPEAEKLTRNLSSVLQTQAELESGSEQPPRNLRLHSPPAPQQSNGSDCGMYALAIAECIANMRAKQPDASLDGDAIKQQLQEEVTPQNIADKRERILQLINQRAKKEPLQ